VSSIRQALLARLLGGALVLLLAGALLLIAGVRALLTAQFDSSLHAKLRAFAALIEQEGYAIELNFIDQAMPELSAEVEPEYISMWLAGEVLYRSPSLGAGLAPGELPCFAGTDAEPLVRDLELPDGRAGRAIGAEMTIQQYAPGPEEAPEDPGPARVVLVLARGRAELDRALLLLLGGTLAGILALLAAGVFLGRGAVRRGLEPLEDLSRHVAAIDDPLTATPLVRGDLPDELAPLVRGHNQMLERIAKAFERERRTAAHIAHELRAPLSELILLAETAQRGDGADAARRLAELRDVAGQMSSLIATLLELARMDSGQMPLEIEAIDLAEILRACWSPLAAGAAGKGQTIDLPHGAGPWVSADRAALSILLTNLLGNAIDHAPPGERIACAIEVASESCRLVLSNAANGLAPADLDKLTEPFWRASQAREDRSHAGLGLSLAGRLAELQGLELSFALELGEFRARLGFARAPG
jgi:two-component system sensor histidine kinase QseC